MSCILCQILKEEIPYHGIIKKYNYWTIMVSREQHTIGTLVIILNRHIVRFSKISKEELNELQHIQNEIEHALDDLFTPQLYNYLQCGNSVEHLHFHVIPRYKTQRVFNGKTYVDENYGNTVKETFQIESAQTITLLNKAIGKFII